MLKLLIAFIGLFGGVNSQAPAVIPTYVPLPPITYTGTSGTYSPKMTFGSITLPAANISYANADYTVNYILVKALDCGMGIKTTTPVIFTTSPQSISYFPMLNSTSWVEQARPIIVSGCATYYPTITPTIPKGIVPSYDIQQPRPSIIYLPSVTSTPTQTPKTDIIIDTVKESSTPTSYNRYSVSSTPTNTPTQTLKADIIIDTVKESPTPTSYNRYSVSSTPTNTPKSDVVIDTVKESPTPTSYNRYTVSSTPTNTPKSDVVIDTVKESSTPTSYNRYTVSSTPTNTPKSDVVIDTVKGSPTPTSYNRYTVSSTPTNTLTQTPTQTLKADVIIDTVKESSTPTSYNRYTVSSTPTNTPKEDGIIDTVKESSTPSSTSTPSRTPSRTYYKFTSQTLRGSKSPYPSRIPITTPTRFPTKYPVSTAYIQFIQSKLPLRSLIARPSITQKIPPKVINSGISLPGVNTTALIQPSSLQQLQTALACTLQTPLENIQITNITYTDSKGTHTIEYDKSIPTLSSNGSIVCLIPKMNTTSTGRRLQDTTNPTVDSTVTIDYAIVEPPMDVVTATPDDFIDIISSSQVLIDMTSSIGATNIDTIVPLELLSYSATGPEQEPPQSSTDKAPIYIGVALCVAGISGIAAAVVIVNKRRKLNSPIKNVVHVIEMNPVVNKSVAETSFRAFHLPNQVRN